MIEWQPNTDNYSVASGFGGALYVSGYAGFPGRDVRAKLDHPVVDADAHVVEPLFAIEGYMREVAGPQITEKWLQRKESRIQTKGIWWGAPSGAHTANRAMAMLPKFFRSRMDECGIDFAHMLTTYGLGDLYLQDEDQRIAFCRSVNTPEVSREAPHLGQYAPNWRSIAYDAPHDYDPFWKRCVELGIAPICHTDGRGMGYRRSPSNYMFNHIGGYFGCEADDRMTSGLDRDACGCPSTALGMTRGLR